MSNAFNSCRVRARPGSPPQSCIQWATHWCSRLLLLSRCSSMLHCCVVSRPVLCKMRIKRLPVATASPHGLIKRASLWRRVGWVRRSTPISEQAGRTSQPALGCLLPLPGWSRHPASFTPCLITHADITRRFVDCRMGHAYSPSLL